MIRRRRNVPWIQKNSRLIIGAIALIGLILTSYLTIPPLVAVKWFAQEKKRGLVVAF